MAEDPEPRLPRLHPLTTLSRAPDHPDGSPSWTLHNPVSNEYYRLEWAEFECLARFSLYKTPSELVAAINRETALHIETGDVEKLIAFLNEKGLLSLSDQTLHQRESDNRPAWKKLLHHYLFCTLPLIKPQKFLQATLPMVRPLLSRSFLGAMLGIFLLGMIFVLQRSDEFFHTFMQLFSPAGIVMGLVIFALVKIAHEMAHAYTATKYGVPVPHMGVAFIVLYPVLYTETTGSWQLPSPRQRLHIGMAGILAELCLAGLFLWVWLISPAGSIGQSIAFTTVAITLIGSLLVNLNPLMRFDGYYMLCDLLGIDNLQDRACAFARWKLRRTLFSLEDSAPEILAPARQKFLIFFGFSLLIYRFFLFMGIALLVYMLFPKPLGAFLMSIELLWFILLPIWREIKVWTQRRGDILVHKASWLTFGVIGIVFLLGIIPWHRTLSVPAILHAAAYTTFYPVADARVDGVMIIDGQTVAKGQVLARLSSDSLDKDLRKTRATLKALGEYRRRLQADPAQSRAALAQTEAEIAMQQQRLSGYEQQQERMIITAPFDGQIRDMNPELHAGRYIRGTEMLFRLIVPGPPGITAYVGEEYLARIDTHTQAQFIPSHAPFDIIPATLTKIDPANTRYLPWPALSSVYGGPLPSNRMPDHDSTSEQIELLQSFYAVQLTPNSAYPFDNINDFSTLGFVQLEGKPRSLLADLGRRFLSLFIRESGLN